MTENYRNRLLRLLAAQDISLLDTQLELVRLNAGDRLVERGTPPSHVIFPVTCVCSVLVTGAGSAIEVGMFGCDGMSKPLLRARPESDFDIVVSIGGTAYLAHAGAFDSLLDKAPSLSDLVRRYADYTMVQRAYAARANGVFSVDARVARWLLMAADRLPQPRLAINHADLARLLSVRRSGVTLTIRKFVDAGLVANRRGHFEIFDRVGLLRCAGESYGQTERAYRELVDVEISTPIQDRSVSGHEGEALTALSRRA